MRLLFLIERYHPDLGGVARSGERTARALSALGVDVEVLAWTRSLAPGQLETQPAPLSSTGPMPVVHRLGLFSNWDLSMQHTMNVLQWLHGKQPYDAVWGHYLFPAGFMAVLFAETESIKSIVSARGNDLDRLMFPPGDFGRLVWALERATIRMSVSRDLARKIDVLLGRDAEVEVVPNAVDISMFSQATPTDDRDDGAAGPAAMQLRAELGIEADEVVLGFCGEVRHKKGLPFLLTALAEVRAVRPACLLIIGDVRARERVQFVQFSIQHPEVAARILETGHLPDPRDVARHLRLCDLTLVPSVWDGLPNAMLESMACGVPVVASDAGGIPEVIRHGRDGVIIPRAQLHRLGEAILEVLALPAGERAELGTQARLRVASDYDGRQEKVALSKLLQKLSISGRERGPGEMGRGAMPSTSP